MAVSAREQLFGILAREASFAPFATPISEVADAIGGAEGRHLAEAAAELVTVGGLFYGVGPALLGARSPAGKALVAWAEAVTVPLPPPPPRPGNVSLLREAQAWLDQVGLGADIDRETGVGASQVRHALRPESGVSEAERDKRWAWLATQAARRARREAEVTALSSLPVAAEVARVRDQWVTLRARLKSGVPGAPIAPPELSADRAGLAIRFAGPLRYGRPTPPVLVTVGNGGTVHASPHRPSAERDGVDWALAALLGVFGPDLADQIVRAPWRSALERIRPSPRLAPPAAPVGPTRLRWRVVSQGQGLSITPVGYDGDAKMALGETFPTERLSLLDRTLARVFQAERWHPNGQLFDAACAGDLDAIDGDGRPLAVVPRAPVLRVEASGPKEAQVLVGVVALGGRVLSPAQVGHATGVSRMVEVADGELRVFDVTPLRHPGFASVAQAFELGIPVEAAPLLLERLSAALPQIEIVAEPALYGTEEPPDATPVVEVTTKGGVRARLVVVPLRGGASFAPGAGEPRVFVGARSAFAMRDLATEHARATPVAERLALPRALATPAEVSAFLAQVRDLGDTVRLVWDGGARALVRRVTAKDLRLSVRSARSWLEIGGDAEVDGVRVALEQLFAHAATGDTVLVVGDQLLELEDALAKQLATLARDAGRMTTLAALTELSELADAGAVVAAPTDWSTLRDRQRAAATSRAAVPASLQTELRAYQEVGFAWLAGLAGWAPGALLCDDMGLGKTVQTLALLLYRMAEGAALVIAPTSVVSNWHREAARFAPDLRLRAYHGASRALAEVQPGDVVLTTWDLLVRDVEALAGVRFATVVFDEAQAAKNPQSKRSQAARRLDAGFRVVLSGTPIENRLSDLWSLATFGVPGLFGTWDFFKERFAKPVEVDHDPTARSDLARVLSPFLLRRRKEEVARDLPPRIEVVERIALSPEERAVYDGERIRALAVLTGSTPENERRFQALAALTKLRQLACHPDPGGATTATSTKLDRLVELIDELRAEGRATLVFSSFVRLLDRTETALTASGARCLRLDGSTPLALRQERVDAFQAGAADVFLISLKAGGTGLNLTAADTVFLLDPWWNPAAEAQAADRAHRIGQDKPVTIYRLVAEQTVEEAILSMQAEKRALVSSVLDDEAVHAAISLDDVAAILSFGGVPGPTATPVDDFEEARFAAWLKAQGIPEKTVRLYVKHAANFVDFLDDIGSPVPPPDPDVAIGHWCRGEGIPEKGPAVTAVKHLLRHLAG